MNRNSNILHALSTQPLAILPGHIEAFIANAFSPTKNTAIKGSLPLIKQQSIITNNQQKQIKIIPIEGVIMPDSWADYGILGMTDVQNELQKAADDASIFGVILHIDSGGGSMLNVAETADMIFSFEKPIMAYIENYGASAAWYLAAATNYIMATTRTSFIGNVGSKISYLDYTGIYEAAGAKMVEVFGTQAINKGLGYQEARTGDYEKMRSILVDPANEMFVNDVMRYRPAMPAESLDGMAYYSEMALEKGYVDGLGSLQDLINLMISTPKNSKNQIKNTMSKTIKMEVPSAFASAVRLFGAVDIPEEAIEAVPPVVATIPDVETTPPVVADVALITQLTASLTEKTTELAAEKATRIAAENAFNALKVAASASNPAIARSVARQDGVDIAPVSPEATSDVVLLNETNNYLKSMGYESKEK